MGGRETPRKRSDFPIVYMGMFGELSALPLRRLLGEGEDVRAVVVPRRNAVLRTERPFGRVLPPPTEGSPLPILRPPEGRNAVEIAWEGGVPAYEVTDPNDAEWLGELSSHMPDLIVVSCFPQRLGPALLKLPRHGVLNLHPSLLPAYRGPDPLFWVFRQGEKRTGVTVHFAEKRLDAGDIVGQRATEIPEGITGDALRRSLAEEGADLLAEVVRSLRRGNLSRKPQDPGAGSHFPAPTAKDFEVSAEWSARRAHNFIRGVGAWGPVTIVSGEQRIRVRSALSFSEEATMEQAVAAEGGVVSVRFNPGILRVEV